MRIKPHYMTEEQEEFLKDNVIGMSNKELTNLFNTRFGLHLGIEQIKTAKRNRGLTNGLPRGFTQGIIPWNKGTKGIVKANKTTFKKGEKPHNYKPVGTEVLDTNGYIKIKVSDPDKWKLKHIIVWEEVNGPVPKDYSIIFGDKNNRNFDINNLLLVPKKLLGTLNTKGLRQEDTESTKTGIVIAEIIQKISKLKRESKHEK